MAVAASWSAAAALCWLAAWSRATESFTWRTPPACSPLALEMSRTRPAVRWMEGTTDCRACPAASAFSTLAAASGEQASGVSQISKAMQQVDQITQRNAAAAEELAATAEELSRSAAALNGLLDFFRHGERQGPAASAPHLSIPLPLPGKPAGGNGATAGEFEPF